jgi:3-mercaptopropionate dioxygenase
MIPSLHPRLSKNVTEIERILASEPAPAQRVGALMANLAAATEVLDGLTYTFDSHHYARGLIYGDPGGRYSILALIWQPDQVTPLHAHRTWCAVTMLSGKLTETTYELPRGAAKPRRLSQRRLAPGDTSCDSGEGTGVHRIRNDSHTLAISLHVYGVAADRIDDGVNIVLA